MCLTLLSVILMSLLVSYVMSQPKQGNAILFNPLVVCYNFCSDGKLSSQCHSLHLVSRDHKIVIFSSLCKFIYCCLEIMFRLVITKKEFTCKGIIRMSPLICNNFPFSNHVVI